MRESRVEAALVRAVRELGGLAIKLGGVGHRGLPDRLVLLPCGRVRFIELKAPGRRPSLLQARFHARLQQLGFAVAVLDSLEAVTAWMEAL